jgi:hypothetical protein
VMEATTENEERARCLHESMLHDAGRLTSGLAPTRVTY